MKFDVIEYKNVILLFILNQCYDEDCSIFSKNICDWILNVPKLDRVFKTPCFGNDKGIGLKSKIYIEGIFEQALIKLLPKLSFKPFDPSKELEILLKESNDDLFFSDEYKNFSSDFFTKLDSYSIYLRHKLIHIASYYLRLYGSLDAQKINKEKESSEQNLSHIYIIADVINRIIKIHREKTEDKAHIIIDRLKNSYEMVYFREKYSGFYMVSNERDDLQRLNSIKNKINDLRSQTALTENIKLVKDLDETEYKTNEFSKGIFETFDIENCVQKADYHIWFDLKYEDENSYSNFVSQLKKSPNSIPHTNEYYIYQPFLIQVLKLIALIQQPGLITPTYPERTMQIAFNARFNSGCISRQVGAVVTDKNFSVKGIGWNDVPVGQIPCSMRDARDLIAPTNNSQDSFTPFEKGETSDLYPDKKSFNTKIKEDFKAVMNIEDQLKGRPCAFCFKTHHNAYEGVKNQVHTRSLHAEENAMLQIAKFGGQPLLGGNLFTTASPCELCSKKAYQLGIKNIFYIDLYPGISQKQILEGGKKDVTNPHLYQFSGAIGRGYLKLYEPFMSIKDETVLRSGIKPSVSNYTKVVRIKDSLEEEFKKNENTSIRRYFDTITDKEDVLEKVIDLMRKGLKYSESKD